MRVFGIFGHPEAANLTYLGLYALQHRGQEGCGIVSADGQQLYAGSAWGWSPTCFGTTACSPGCRGATPSACALLDRRRQRPEERQPIMVDYHRGRHCRGA